GGGLDEGHTKIEVHGMKAPGRVGGRSRRRRASQPACLFGRRTCADAGARNRVRRAGSERVARAKSSTRARDAAVVATRSAMAERRGLFRGALGGGLRAF